MPRDGSHVYTQPFDDVDPATTIESAVYNGFTHDIEFDLNQPRPIIAGGTGATSADGALQNLSGEKAAQLVTNYDSHLWLPGSFRSAAGATGAPVADHSFAGVVYINEALTASGVPPTNQNIVIEARDLDDEEEVDEETVPIIPGRVYAREKRDGVWSDWTEPGAGYVLKRGDTMTGPLTLPGNPTAALHAVPRQYVDGAIGAVKTANYSVLETDRNAIIRGTGSWTLAHTVLATGNTGFRYTIKNDGLATITIDPAGAELIDGAATLKCLSKQHFDVVCDGTDWFTIGRQRAVIIETKILSPAAALADFTMPPDYLTFELDITNWTNTIVSQCWMRFATDGVPNFIVTSSYISQLIYNNTSSTLSTGLTTAAAAPIGLGQYVGGTGVFRGIISPDAPIKWHFLSNVSAAVTGERFLGNHGGLLNVAGRATHLRLFPSGGGNMGGTYVLSGKAA